MIKEIDYHIIGSGSSGNCVRIGDIMFDCGLPYSRIKPDLYKVDTLLITHRHSDHVKESTLRRIQKEFPRIVTYGNYDVGYEFDIDKIIGDSEFDLRRKRHIISFYGVHDVPVLGYVIQKDGLNILYMTDTEEVTAPTEIKYDYMFLESNYDEKKLREIGKQYKAGKYDPTDSVFRHLSTHQCKEFYYVNRRTPESVLVELHKSKRFY